MVGMVIQTRQWSILATHRGYCTNSNATVFLDMMATEEEDIARLLNEGATTVSHPSLMELLQDYFERPEESKA